MITGSCVRQRWADLWRTRPETPTVRLRDKPVLVDTNVILEAHLTGCWDALAGGYNLETVEKCIEETQTGNQLRERKVEIDERALRASLTVNEVDGGQGFCQFRSRTRARRKSDLKLKQSNRRLEWVGSGLSSFGAQRPRSCRSATNAVQRAEFRCLAGRKRLIHRRLLDGCRGKTARVSKSEYPFDRLVTAAAPRKASGRSGLP